MAARSRAAAVAEFRHLLQRVLSSVTTAVVHEHPTGPSIGKSYALTIANGDAVPLRGPNDLSFAITVYFDFERDESHDLWSIVITGYLYTVEDLAGRSLVAYHWHPSGQSRVKWQHLHLGPAAEVGRKPLLQAHLPTSVVTLNEILRMLIEDLGVQPLRRDWERVLAAPTVS